MLTFVDILNMQRPMTERSVEEERRHAVGRDVSIEEIFTHLIKPSLITKRLYTHVNRCLEAIHHHAAEPKMQFSGLNDVCGGVMSASVSSGPRFFQRSSESLQVLHSQSSVFSTLKVPCDGDRWMYHRIPLTTRKNDVQGELALRKYLFVQMLYTYYKVQKHKN